MPIRLLVLTVVGSTAFAVSAPRAHGNVRSGSTTRFLSPDQPAPSFPGLASVKVEYETTGTLRVVAVFRREVGSPGEESFLRHTSVTYFLGDAFGAARVADDCSGAGREGLFVRVALGARTATILFGRSAGDLTVPVELARDGLTMSMTATDSRLAGRNLICFEASMRDESHNRWEFDDGGGMEASGGVLFDGMSMSDGAVGAQAAASLAEQLSRVSGRRVTGQSHAATRQGWVECLPRARRARVRCRGAVTTRRGAARLHLNGWLLPHLRRGRDALGDVGLLVHWTQNVRVGLRFAPCPPRLGTAPRPCEVHRRWRGGPLGRLLPRLMG
ncbi:MAG: hypothetical protein QOI98_2353 [Solirubrobacteraceae bacterium]|nr:hypothetical protein [Solirubrobacteraceae bacterium]